jgi:UDP-glucose 4-epimerase
MLVEGLLIEEHIRVLKFMVETILHLLHTRDDSIQVTVTRYKNDEAIGSVHRNSQNCLPSITKAAFALRCGDVLFVWT